MKSIVLLFWRICIFQTGPESVPANNTLMVLVIAANAVLSVAVALLLGRDDGNVLQATTLAVVNLAGTGALVWFVMWLMDLRQRVPQTLTAVFGADFILTTITSALFAATDMLGQAVAFFVITALTLWTLAVYGFIFHRAMNIHVGFGIAIALFVVVFSVAITRTAIAP